MVPHCLAHRSRVEQRMKFTRPDYTALESSFITREIAAAAGLYRVNSIEGRDLIGRRNGSGDYAGIVFPYRPPGETHSVLDRLRLDHPPVDASSGKPAHKYLTAPSERNRLYFPPCDAALVTDPSIPLIITEGEKKCLALWRMALELSNGTGRPVFLPVALPGVWNWRGVIGSRINAAGERVAEKGVLPDFDLIPWVDRKVTLLFDSNVSTNESVRAARTLLARELTRRGAVVWLADLPASPGVNGCDDFLHLFGTAKLQQEVLDKAHRWLWREDLLVNDKGQPLPLLANAITTLRSAPEWYGLLAWDEFALRISTMRDTPWGRVEKWTDRDTFLMVDWFQHKGLRITITDANAAVETVAGDNTSHPVRDYLEALKWDGTQRISDWLTLYMGADAPKEDIGKWDYIRAVGRKWLISGVARILDPGCQVDHVLILEGPQGQGKSTALRILGDPFFSDDIPELGSKDASQATAGVWIVELSELGSMRRADVSKVKSFITRRTDRFRPPYGRRVVEAPRHCIFAGSVNDSSYLADETGGRRFWPIQCGKVDLESLRRDRNQLWAEAVARYQAKEPWWLDSRELIEAATSEQETRYQSDPWEAEIAGWLNGQINTEITTADVLKDALKKDIGQWSRGDETRVGLILRRLKWEPGARPRSESRRRVYVQSPAD